MSFNLLLLDFLSIFSLVELSLAFYRWNEYDGGGSSS